MEKHNFLPPHVVCNDYDLSIDLLLLGYYAQYIGLPLDTLGDTTLIFRKTIRSRPTYKGIYTFGRKKIRIAVSTCINYLASVDPSNTIIEQELTQVLAHELAHLYQEVHDTPLSSIDRLYFNYYQGALRYFMFHYLHPLHRLIVTAVYSQGIEKHAQNIVDQFFAHHPNYRIVKLTSHDQ